MAQVLLLGKKELELIAKTKAHAQKNIVTLDKIVAYQEAGSNPDNFGHSAIMLPYGFSVIYLIEEQSKGLFIHLSVTTVDRFSYPEAEIIAGLMEVFGMSDCEEDVYDIRTNIGNDRHGIVIDLWQKIKLENIEEILAGKGLKNDQD